MSFGLAFSTSEYTPATAPTRALQDMRARRRRAMPLATVAACLDPRHGEAQPSLDLRARHLSPLLAVNRAHRVRVAHGRQRRPAPAWGGCSIMVECAAVISPRRLFSSGRATALWKSCRRWCRSPGCAL